MPYTHSPLYDWFRLIDIDDLPVNEKEALQERFDLTTRFFQDIAFRQLNKNFWIAFIHGEGGSGKSSIGRFIYKSNFNWLSNSEQGKKLINDWIGQGFKSPQCSANFFTFSDLEFMSVSGKAQPLDIIVKDEDYETSSQIGGKALKERKRMLLSRIRALQLNFILIDPIFSEISELRKLYTYIFYAHDKDYENGLLRAVLSLKDYQGVFHPVGHIKAKFIELEGYEEKKMKQLLEVKRMQQPEYKQKQLDKISKAMVEWVDVQTGEKDDIRDYVRNSWANLIKRRMDVMGIGGFRAGTEIKEIKDNIDGLYPIHKRKFFKEKQA